MRINKDFRRARNYEGSEQTKGKLVPRKERVSKNSFIDELEEEEEIGYLSLREKESIADYFDDADEDYIIEEFDDEKYYYQDEDDEEFDDEEYEDDEEEEYEDDE